MHLLLALLLQDPRAVDEAIRKAAAWLKTAPSPAEGNGIENSDELILLALLHAGLPTSDARVSELLKGVLEAPLTSTYKVAVQAMALEELDRVKHQARVYHCAQFLVDNQAESGQWGYGTPTPLGEPPGGTPTPGAERKAPAAADLSAVAPREKPKVVRRIPVKAQRSGEGGDNSNSQYAALGLRACHDAGIVLPRETVERAAAWWRRNQAGAVRDDDDDEAPGKRKPVATPGGRQARGWGYGGGERDVTGSMTAGAVGALVIYAHILGQDWKKEPSVASGVAWLADNFTVTRNPGQGQEWHFYYLYGLERAGVLYDAPTFGRHAWYTAGAKFLLQSQKPDGSWSDGGDEENATWNTCFAVLFLRRSTRPVVDVPSVDRYYKSRSEAGK
jgi:hypothetical protein